jgi:hypothetical protein
MKTNPLRMVAARLLLALLTPLMVSAAEAPFTGFRTEYILSALAVSGTDVFVGSRSGTETSGPGSLQCHAVPGSRPDPHRRGHHRRATVLSPVAALRACSISDPPNPAYDWWLDQSGALDAPEIGSIA